jgi:integrating conjugative element protein (TIGR03752 family)
MALSLKSNKLVPILGIAILVIASVAILRSGTQAPPQPTTLTAVPTPKPGEPATADADSPADSLRTVASEVKKMRADMEQLTGENKKLRTQNEDLMRNRNDVVDDVTRRLGDQLARSDAAKSPVFSGLSTRLDQLEQTISRYGAKASDSGAGDVPAGLGYSQGGAPGGSFTGEAPAPSADMLTWIEPMAHAAPGNGGKVQSVAFRDPADPAPPPDPANLPATLPATAAPASSAPPKPAAVPYFTVPENATLIGSTTMTSLIGRIPVSGKVTDPVPFKALIGRPNLAANGFEVPDAVVGMVASGKAVGDWTLSCVYGNVESVTFLFDDGTIRTVSNRKPGAGMLTSGAISDDRIAWLSDEHGVPCISGQKITNAPTWLATRGVLKTLEAAAQAAAAAQTTSSVNVLGGASSVVTGDQGKYIAGKAAAGGAEEISDWVRARMDNSFDAIYVPAGVSVALHLDRAIELDKLPDARKLDYHRPASRPAGYASRLD